MQLIIDGTTAETTRNEIVGYLRRCAEVMKEMGNFATTKQDKAIADAENNLLAQIAGDLAGAKLHVNVLRKE